MNRTRLRRIIALETKFPPPLPDWSHLNIDELYALKMLLARRFIAMHKKSGSQLPLPPLVADVLDCQTPMQRAAARKAAGLRLRTPALSEAPPLVPKRTSAGTADRKPEAHLSPSQPIEPARRMLWNPTTLANERRGAPRSRRQCRASRG